MKFTCTVTKRCGADKVYDAYCGGTKCLWMVSPKDISGEYEVDIKLGDRAFNSTILRIDDDTVTLLGNDDGVIYTTNLRCAIVGHVLYHKLNAMCEKVAMLDCNRKRMTK